MPEYERLIEALQVCASRTDCINCDYFDKNCLRPAGFMQEAAYAIRELLAEVKACRKRSRNISGIIVRDMSMPTGCASCDFGKYGSGVDPYCQRLMQRITVHSARLADCPLAPIQEVSGNG